MADYYDDDFEFEEAETPKNKKQKDLFEVFDEKSKNRKSKLNDYPHNNKSIGKFEAQKKKSIEDDDYADDFDND